MRLLLDENISPSLAEPLWSLGVDAIAVRDRKLLGASDWTVWMRAQQEERTVVTIDASDFERIARKSDEHHGVVTIPSGARRDQQYVHVSEAINWARMNNVIMPSLRNWFVTVDQTGAILAEYTITDDLEVLERMQASAS